MSSATGAFSYYVLYFASALSYSRPHATGAPLHSIPPVTGALSHSMAHCTHSVYSAGALKGLFSKLGGRGGSKEEKLAAELTDYQSVASDEDVTDDITSDDGDVVEQTGMSHL